LIPNSQGGDMGGMGMGMYWSEDTLVFNAARGVAVEAGLPAN